MPKKSNFIYLILVLIMVTSCGDNAIFDEYKSVTNAWNKNDIVTFKISPKDTINPYNLFVNIRTTNAYKYNNLFLVVEMDFPNGRIINDTLEYRMAYKTGELMGEGISSVKTNKLWYKEAVRFNEEGDYTVKIQHAMRKNGEVNGITNLQGVTDVGFRIEALK